MNINFTLISQAIAFSVFIWFTVKFVWPPLLRAIEERQKTIADGLAAGERGRHELELASQRSSDVLREAKQRASEIILQAEKRATEIVEEAKRTAKEEGLRGFYKGITANLMRGVCQKGIYFYFYEIFKGMLFPKHSS